MSVIQPEHPPVELRRVTTAEFEFARSLQRLTTIGSTLPLGVQDVIDYLRFAEDPSGRTIVGADTMSKAGPGLFYCAYRGFVVICRSTGADGAWWSSLEVCGVFDPIDLRVTTVKRIPDDQFHGDQTQPRAGPKKCGQR